MIKMNLCFVIGKIVSDIKFEFIINSKNISVAIFEIELSNNSTVKVKGYNEIADYCYKDLKNIDTIMIQGRVEENGKIEISVIFKINYYLTCSLPKYVLIG